MTARIGALESEHLGGGYLGSGRSLGECRLLWEIGSEGVEVRSLRVRLGLDSGYVSRLLRALDSQGLIAVETSGADRRVRVARLTPEGAREREELDRLSDELAWSILEPLRADQRRRLAEAAQTVERLLLASQVTIAVEDPRSDDAQSCLGRYVAELAERFEGGFDPTRSISAGVEEMTPPRGLLVVARLHEEPVGCGALKHRPGGAPTEVKRMWVDASVRGLGVGRRLLCELERHARSAGVTRLRLETNGSLSEAIGLYRSSGYAEVPAFNDEPYAHHWFEKHLGQDG